MVKKAIRGWEVDTVHTGPDHDKVTQKVAIPDSNPLQASDDCCALQKP